MAPPQVSFLTLTIITITVVVTCVRGFISVVIDSSKDDIGSNLSPMGAVSNSRGLV